eukprot:TRINITY_DN66709_c0_g1_i1.p1 TRINITY_DN66709_c0_g1~~TRINITY_DN66709_c0_g1_i1.p1  ORF type:complete len:182 (-),score=34.88 TRINITY_DN66709_c0_g1_i1:38-583(-)
MDFAVLGEKSHDGKASLGWVLFSRAAKQGALCGAACGLTAAPAVWLLQGRRRPLYHDLLPRGGLVGVCGGCALGALAMSAIAATSDSTHLQAMAAPADPKLDRLDRWTCTGACFGALMATPGPGSLLFHNTHWLPRLGGGAAVGLVTAFLLELATRDPEVQRHLPASIVPKEVVDLLPGGK